MQFLLVEFSNPSRIVTTDVNYAGTQLTVRYAAEPGPLVWPPFDRLQRQSGLWESTCFELFLSRPNNPEYLELNLSPSGAWNCFSFSDNRLNMKESNAMTVNSIVANANSLTANLECDPALEGTTYELGLSAVLQKPGGELDHFALSHGVTPDFHNRDHHVAVQLENLVGTFATR